MLGIELVEATNGHAEAQLSLRDDLSSSEHADIAHGGVTYALADHVGGMAIISLVEDVCPTIDMRIDYLALARSDLRATATVVRRGGQVASVDVDVYDAAETHVATARGIYKVGRSPSEDASESSQNPWLDGRSDQ
ncbi:PaaI family thioesterase (plasmid) [Haloterrigena alkaliphila]|nr:PaaI family thioesterase [Haloterrigena alkaliphila]UHQ95179.1 PaaI family thioesterase [Haloterrigena alkaliphila]